MMCAYCFRPSVATVIIRNGPLRKLFGLPTRRIRVCRQHIARAGRR
jgi:hypothetical protein